MQFIVVIYEYIQYQNRADTRIYQCGYWWCRNACIRQVYVRVWKFMKSHKKIINKIKLTHHNMYYILSHQIIYPKQIAVAVNIILLWILFKRNSKDKIFNVKATLSNSNIFRHKRRDNILLFIYMFNNFLKLIIIFI